MLTSRIADRIRARIVQLLESERRPALSTNRVAAMSLLMFAILVGLGQAGRVEADRVANTSRAKIPPALPHVLTQRFPAYRLPRVTDNLNEDVRFNLAQ